MKRGAIGIAGFALGLLWVWACLYALGHTEWVRPTAKHSCVDAGDCTWPGIVAAISYVLIPPILFGILSGAAWRRWTVQKWAGRLIGLGVLTAAFYAAIAIMTREA